MTNPSTPAAAVSLHDLIMNLPARADHQIDVAHEFSSPRFAYKSGHRDARHAAAELSTTREAALIAELDQLRAVAGWNSITEPGQVGAGDLVTFTIGDASHVRRVRRVLFAGQPREELIYDIKRNHYLITSMSMRNEGSQKNVMFHKRPPLPDISAPAVEGE